jgi:multiple sugar transport system substrate-binding protein
MFAFGGMLYDDASGKVTANDPKNVEAFTFLKDFWQGMGDIDQLTAFAQRPGQLEAGNPFATGQSVHVFDGFWYYEAIDQYAPDMSYGVGYWPTPNGTEEEKKNWMIGGWQYSLPKGIPNADESWKFMRYMFVDNSAKMGCDTLNGPCVVAQFQDWITCLQGKMGPDNRMAPYLKVFTEQAQVATKYFPIIENQAFYGDELTRVFDLMIRDQLEPQAALDEVTTSVQADLDKIRSGAS